ncbi:putative CyP450 monooxygenase [Rickenella mellea]|uniref:Putative CyP450 monooxygenase n=1 Tax=Rickenella mellea TaxID=50990 RepID=A0A4Y7PYX4_9AGAM|nr:putative CyP450 monooxygenase [Rickenella mellea]
MSLSTLLNYLEHSVVYVLVTLGVFLLYLRKQFKHAHPLPPGPPRLPIIGNFRDMPTKSEWLTYREWAKQYGDIIHVSIFAQSMIIINSYEKAFDLFERRSSNYSDRPNHVMMNDLWWRRHRKLFHQKFNVNAVQEYRPLQTEVTHDLLRRLLKNPPDFVAHLRYTAGALILRVAYGISIAPENDPNINTAEEALKALSATGRAGAYLVDTLPICKITSSPLLADRVKTQCDTFREWRKYVSSMKESPFAAVKKSMESGILNSGFAPSQLHTLEDKKRFTLEEEEIIKNTAASIYVAGTDTTVSAMSTFVLAMTLHPDIQRRAQQTIDLLLGGERLPEYSDRPYLPYIDAILKETIRWQSVLPLAVPHVSINDDVYDGYRIPAGSIVVGNAWSMLHNEKIYPNAFEFNPSRFLKTDGTGKLMINPDIPDPALVAFGFGRRVCAGQHFADESVWIAIVSVLSVYDVSKAVDDSGQEIIPAVEYTTGLLSFPEPFKCKITPRSPAAECLIRATTSDR